MSKTYKNNEKSKDGIIDNIKPNVKANSKSSAILDAMGQIGDKYILEASEVEKVSMDKKIMRFMHKFAPVAAAAVAAVVILAITTGKGINTNSHGASDDNIGNGGYSKEEDNGNDNETTIGFGYEDEDVTKNQNEITKQPTTNNTGDVIDEETEILSDLVTKPSDDIEVEDETKPSNDIEAEDETKPSNNIDVEDETKPTDDVIDEIWTGEIEYPIIDLENYDSLIGIDKNDRKTFEKNYSNIADGQGKFVEIDIDNDGDTERVYLKVYPLNDEEDRGLECGVDTYCDDNGNLQEMCFVISSRINEMLRIYAVSLEGKNYILIQIETIKEGQYTYFYELREYMTNGEYLDYDYEGIALDYNRKASHAVPNMLNILEILEKKYLKDVKMIIWDQYLENVVCSNSDNILTKEDVISRPFKWIFDGAGGNLMYPGGCGNKTLFSIFAGFWEHVMDEYKVNIEIGNEESTERKTIAFDGGDVYGEGVIEHDLDGNGEIEYFDLGFVAAPAERNFYEIVSSITFRKANYMYPDFDDYNDPRPTREELIFIELFLPEVRKLEGYYPDELLDAGYVLDCIMYDNYIVFYTETVFDGDVWSNAIVVECVNNKEFKVIEELELSYNRDTDSDMVKELADYYSKIFGYNKKNSSYDSVSIAKIGYGNIKPVFDFFKDNISSIGYSNEYNDIYGIMKLYVDKIVAGE